MDNDNKNGNEQRTHPKKANKQTKVSRYDKQNKIEYQQAKNNFKQEDTSAVSVSQHNSKVTNGWGAMCEDSHHLDNSNPPVGRNW